MTKESACFDRLSEDTEKRVIPMYKDHSGMNKFGARSDSDYQALIGKIKELAAFAGNMHSIVLLIFLLTMLRQQAGDFAAWKSSTGLKTIGFVGVCLRMHFPTSEPTD